MISFKNKIAVITGGTRGIGKAIANLICKAGGDVIVTGRNPVVKEFAKKTRMEYIPLDFLNQRSIDDFLSGIIGLKSIDILINNAGINIIEPIDQLNYDNWDKILKVNLTGPMLLTKAVSNIMKRSLSGRILNISSIFGIVSKEQRGSYSASKSGLIGLTRAMALDLAKHGILVNALCPGFTLTEMTQSILSKKEIISLARQIPLGRFASPIDVAQTAVYLCSDLNTYITGQTLVVDGGFTIK